MEETCFVPAFQSASDGSHSSWPPQRGKLHCSLSSCENWTIYCTPPKFLRWEPENYLFGKGETFYKPLSLLVIVTFHCLTFTFQGFPNIWSYLCYKKTPAWICPYFECWSFKTKYLDQINQVISPLSVLLQVYESMSQTFILCELGMNHSRVVFPKGGCTKMLGNSNSWTVWQSKRQFTNLANLIVNSPIWTVWQTQ